MSAPLGLAQQVDGSSRGTQRRRDVNDKAWVAGGPLYRG